MSKFSWDDYPDYNVVAMDDDGSVFAYVGPIYRFYEGKGKWAWTDQHGGHFTEVFTPAKEVNHGSVEPVYKPNLPPDWWFEGKLEDDPGQEEGGLMQYIDAPGLKTEDETTPSLTFAEVESKEDCYTTFGSTTNWTVNTTLPQDTCQVEEAIQAIWSHFEEFECLPDFLVGDPEVLGSSFKGIPVIKLNDDHV